VKRNNQAKVLLTFITGKLLYHVKAILLNALLFCATEVFCPVQAPIVVFTHLNTYNTVNEELLQGPI